jgi:hypothetical protein
VVVGHVVWNWMHRERPRVMPAPPAPGVTPEAIVSKLRYLVSLAAPGAFLRLQALPNRFWSFVDVSAREAKRDS